jgi:hypothetical protein
VIVRTAELVVETPFTFVIWQRWKYPFCPVVVGVHINDAVVSFV